MPVDPHEWTQLNSDLVYGLILSGLPQDIVAEQIGIAPMTLRKYYRREIDEASTGANAKIAKTLFAQAMEGNTAAAIFWAKVRMGWVEKQKIEHTGEDGKPLNASVQIVLETPSTTASQKAK